MCTRCVLVQKGNRHASQLESALSHEMSFKLGLCLCAGMENLARCSDTRSFIGMLHQLCNPIHEDADPPELPEKQAAKSLFCWEVCCLL